MELTVSDYHFKFQGQRTVDSRLSLILVDQHTAKEYGFPFSRRYYAIVANALTSVGTKVVAFDYIFDHERPQDKLGDQMLVGVTSNNENVIHAWNASLRKSPVSSVYSEYDVPGAITPELSLESGLYNTAGSIYLPYPHLLRASDSLGIIPVVPDADGSIRRIPLLVKHGGRIYPSFALLIACRALNVSPAEAKEGEYLLLRGKEKEIKIPIDSMGQMLVNYTGDMMSVANTRFSFRDVYDSIVSGTPIVPASIFKDKVVIIGTSDPLSSDIYSTPFDNLFPGVAVHFMAVNTILQRRFLDEASSMLNVAVLLVFAAVAALVAILLRPWLAALAIGILMAVLWFISYISFSHGGMMLSFVQPATGVILSFGGTLLYGYMREIREKLRFETELKAAREVQQQLLPESPPEIDELDIASICLPQREVGGDYFDYVWLDEEGKKFGIVIADVQGKGLKAAMAATMVSGMLTAMLAEDARSTGEILSHLNELFYRRMARRTSVCLALAVIDLAKRQVKLSIAGLPEPILKQEGQISSLSPDGDKFPLGLTARGEYQELIKELPEGSTLVFYTDGIPEAMNSKGELYGFARFEEAVRGQKPTLNAQGLLDALLSDVNQFAGKAPQEDDLTLIVVKYSGVKE